MNDKECSLKHGELDLGILFELLNHKDSNYAVFAVSRIKVISMIIGNLSKYPGPQRTRE